MDRPAPQRAATRLSRTASQTRWHRARPQRAFLSSSLHRSRLRFVVRGVRRSSARCVARGQFARLPLLLLPLALGCALWLLHAIAWRTATHPAGAR